MSNKPILNNTRKVVGWNEKKKCTFIDAGWITYPGHGRPGICGR